MRIDLKHRLVNADTVIRIEATGNYSWIYFADGRRELKSTTLLRYEQDLPAFVRISRAHLVNPGFITRMSFGGIQSCFFHMADKTTIRVSHHRLTRTLNHKNPTVQQVIAACRNELNRGEKALRRSVRMV